MMSYETGQYDSRKQKCEKGEKQGKSEVFCDETVTDFIKMKVRHKIKINTLRINKLPYYFW